MTYLNSDILEIFLTNILMLYMCLTVHPPEDKHVVMCLLQTICYSFLYIFFIVLNDLYIFLHSPLFLSSPLLIRSVSNYIQLPEVRSYILNDIIKVIINTIQFWMSFYMPQKSFLLLNVSRCKQFNWIWLILVFISSRFLLNLTGLDFLHGI